MKKSKILITSYIILLVIGLIIFAIGPYLKFKSGSKNIICLSSAIADYEDGYVNICNGIFYKVIDYHRDSITKTEFIFFFQKMKDPAPVKRKFELIDESKECAEALELFYASDNQKYYFSCIKSDKVYVLFNDGRKTLIKDALESKEITIEEVMETVDKIGPDSIIIYKNK